MTPMIDFVDIVRSTEEEHRVNIDCSFWISDKDKDGFTEELNALFAKYRL